MAKQTFTTGQVLTAAQMTSLQQTAMGGGSATAKTASYVLVAADAGTTVIMNAAGATTITVNTSLFAAGDTVLIQNIGAGTCTITAGTATVNTAGSLALVQYESGILYFTATSTAIFNDYVQASAGGGGKVLQVVQTTYTTETSVTGQTMTDSGLSLSITPSSATSKVLVIVNQTVYADNAGGSQPGSRIQLLRGATLVYGPSYGLLNINTGPSGEHNIAGTVPLTYLDSPATTSATTYKTQFNGTAAAIVAKTQWNSFPSTITLLEIGA